MRKITLKNISVDEIIKLYAKHGGKKGVKYFIKTGKLMKKKKR